MNLSWDSNARPLQSSLSWPGTEPLRHRTLCERRGEKLVYTFLWRYEVSWVFPLTNNPTTYIFQTTGHLQCFIKTRVDVTIFQLGQNVTFHSLTTPKPRNTFSSSVSMTGQESYSNCGIGTNVHLARYVPLSLKSQQFCLLLIIQSGLIFAQLYNSIFLLSLTD